MQRLGERRTALPLHTFTLAQGVAHAATAVRRGEADGVESEVRSDGGRGTNVMLLPRLRMMRQPDRLSPRSMNTPPNARIHVSTGTRAARLTPPVSGGTQIGDV